MVLLFNNNKKQYKKTVMSDYLFIVFLLLLNINNNKKQYKKIVMSDYLFIVLFVVVEYPPKWCTYTAGMAGAT